MSMYKIMLIILFVTVSYYPFCGIVGIIRYIRGKKYPRETIVYQDKKQEDILDKIRDEIKFKQEIQLKGEETSEWNKCISEVLEIIDKYKSESEVEE